MELKISEDELEVLKMILSETVVQKRTGSVGIMHGANRFVSTNIILKKQDCGVLSSLYKKLGFKLVYV